MSAIVHVKTEVEITNKRHLVTSLKHLGMDPREADGNTLVYVGYAGATESVSVVVSRRFHDGYGDIGFKKDGDKYTLVMDDSDFYNINNAVGGNFLDKLQQRYSAEVAVATLKSKGYTTRTQEVSGKIKILASKF
jgi:hypothetical protein